MEKIFLPQKSTKNTWLFFILFIAFLIIGIILIISHLSGNIFGTTTGGNQLTIGLIFTIGSALALSIISYRRFSKKPTYILTDKSLIIKPLGISPKTAVFNFSEIKDIEKIPGKEVEKLTTRLKRDSEWQKWTIQPVSMVKNELKFMKLIQYCSLPVAIEKATIRIGRMKEKNIQGIPIYLKTKASGDFILLSIKNGARYLISPKNIDEFISTYKQLKAINNP
ncbi:MAG: hypothetical protein GF387_00580 [Candidatus Portnoybacteria bacterium]|nr:hypothetical protein [Candidatus Portnoybacteria bacterium]